MIIEFSVTNFRSIKEEQIFSFVAEPSKSKPDNVFEAKIRQGISLKEFLEDEKKGEEKSTFETIRLLKSAVIYGANASGKSNVIKAFEVFQDLCVNPIGLETKNYNPFKFDERTANEPTHFKLSFIGPFQYKYQYSFSFNKNEILSEELIYYPLGQARNLFKRVKDTEKKNGLIADTFKKGDDLTDNKASANPKFLFITLSSILSQDRILLNILYYLKEHFQFFNTMNAADLEKWYYEVGGILSKKPSIQKQLKRLIASVDTKIQGLELEENKNIDFDDWNIEKAYEPIGIHKMFNSNKTARLHFKEQSRGTNMLYVLGGKILEQLDKGGTMFIDEIDTSLHPRLAKFLVLLFQHPKSNPKNAQLIFTTHETTFLDRNLFRREQIWFTEKDEYGQTELYSMQDFDKVREDTPFEKWYLAGKFGGLPDIKELEFIFGDGEEN